MPTPLARLGRGCHRHRGLVVAAWLMALLVVLGTVSLVGRATTETVRIPGSDSQAALDAATAGFASTAYPAQPIVMQATSGKLPTLRSGPQSRHRRPRSPGCRTSRRSRRHTSADMRAS